MAIHTPKTREELAGYLSPMRLTAEVFERAVAVGAAESRTSRRVHRSLRRT